MAKMKIKQKMLRIAGKIKLRTWIALGFILIVLPIVLFKFLFKDTASAAGLTALEDSTSITITSPGHYRAVIQKGDTDDYILFYDLSEDANNPDATHEFKGPCVLETSTFCLRDDGSRVTNLVEVTDTVVKVRVMGRFNNEASTDYLDDDTPVYFPDVTENYAFTRDGVSVVNRSDFSIGAGVTFDSDSGHNGYEWLAVYSDVTDGAFDDTANTNYGTGATESTISADGEFANTNSYFHMPGTGTSTYQDGFVGIHRAGWYDDQISSGVHEWQWDENETGTQDLITAQEQNYNSQRRHFAKWYFLLKSESDLDTEAEREALNNEMNNADILSYTVGESSSEQPIGSSGAYFDGSADYVNMGNVSTFNFGDTDDFSIEAWVYLSSSVTSAHVVIGKGGGAGAHHWLLDDNDSVSKRIRLALRDADGSVYTITGTTVLATDTWYHVAAVFDQDSAANSTVYVNGVDDSPTKSGTIGDIGSLSSTNNLAIGVLEAGGGNYSSWLGRIGEVRVWSDVRSASEIRENMLRQIDPNSSNLIGNWRLDEGTGTAVHDESATSADGVFGGNTRWTSVSERDPDHYNEFEFANTLQTTSQNAQYDIDAGTSNVSTTANGAVTDAATTVTVTSTTGFSASGVAYIEGDKFSYTGVTATTFTGVPSSGELSVSGHATGAVVSQFKRTNSNFKIAGYQSTQKPSEITREGVKQKEGVDFAASVKPVTEGYFAQDLSFYADFSSTTPDVGSAMTNSGASLIQGGNDYSLGFLGYFGDSNADITFTSTGNIDYAKGAIDFTINPLSASTDNTERTYFAITDGTDQLRFRKTSGNTLEFLIDEGATTYTESITSSNYSWGLLDTVHIRLEWDDTAVEADQMKIFINGTERTRTDSTGDFTGSLMSPGTTFRLGNSAASGGLFCNCIIDEFKIYDFNGSGNQIGIAKAGAGGAASDYFYNPGNNIALSFSAVDADNRGEYLYLGSDSKVNGFNFDLLTNGVGTSLNLDWEYWNGVTWTSLESISGFADTTANLTQSGSVYWTAPPTNWRPYVMNSRNELYYIRASLNASSGAYTTSPVESRITTSTLYVRSESALESEDISYTIQTQFQPSLFWKMDEGQGTVVNDTSGNKNEGTRSNAAWQTDDLCISGKCLFFDGTGDYVSRANDNSLNFIASDSFSISTWIRHAPIATNPDVIVAKHNGTAGGYKVRMENDGDISCGIDDDSTYSPDAEAVSTAATYDDNKWHHVECVKDGTSSISLYIDGVLITTNSSISGVGTLANTDTFYVGIDGDGSSNGFVGFIDEFKMFPYARSAAEVKTDAIAGASLRGSSAVMGAQDTAFLNDGLLGYWKLNEASGNAADSSGNSLTLTNNGTTTFVSGQFGSGSEHVPASSQYFSTVTSIPSAQTISFWVNPDSTTTNFVNLTASAYINASSGTISATGFTSPTIYVNGVQTSTIVADVWQLVTVTTETPITADTFYIGRANASYMDGTLDEVRLYNRVLGGPEIQSLYSWAPGPIGYWKFDEMAGTTAADSSGNGINGTLYDTASFVNGKYGGAARFDGGDDTPPYAVIEMPDDSLENNTQGTICAWVKPYDTGDSLQHIISISEDDGGTHTDFINIAYDTTSNSMYVDVDDGNVTVLTGGTGEALTTNQWNHFCLTVDPSGNKFYNNGYRRTASYSNGSSSVNTWIDDIDENTTNLTFGCFDAGSDDDSCSAPTQRFEGELDEVRIYDYARSPGQIAEDMNAGHVIGGSSTATQVISWDFDEGNGTTANNQIIGGTSGTLTSMATSPSTSTSGWTASGKYNKALVFDGTDDKVVIATASDANVDFNTNEQFSACAWIYSTTMAGSSERDAIIAKWDATTPTRGYRLTLTNDDADTTGNIRAEVYDESTDQTLSASGDNDTIAENTWYHACMSFNGGVAGAASDLTLYVDGKNVATNALNASFLGLEDVTSDFTVGDYDATDAVAADTAFTGRIDGVQVYSGVLPTSQVKVVYDANASVNFSTGAVESAQTVDGSQTSAIGYWNLNENTGTTVSDSSGNGNALTMSGLTAQSWSPGKIGSGLYFDGTDDYLSIADDADFDFAAADNFTISAWAKSSGSLSAVQHVFVKGDTTDGGWKVYLNTNGNYCAHFADNIDNAPTDSACSDASGYDYNDNQWHHIAAVKTGSSRLDLYIDGELVASDTSMSFAGTLENTASLLIGIGQDASTAEFMGVLDELKIIRAVSTGSQIAFDYNRGAPLARYKFDECTGTTAYNNSKTSNGTAAGNNGTITIGATGTNTSSGSCGALNSATAWSNGSSGKYNASIDLDGTDDYISVTDTSSLRFDASTQDFSIFAWVKRTTTGTEYIVSKEDADNDGWRLLFTSGNAVQCSEDATDVTSTSTITDTNWHHVGCTIDRDGNGQIYIDGKADGSTTAMGTDAMATTSNITIGTRSYTSTNYLNGQIDDVQIFHYALSSMQAKLLFNEGSVARFGPTQGQP